ncbi:TetR/AcrR family transcriptional regulator [Brachybacterium paraconglomeratum]
MSTRSKNMRERDARVVAAAWRLIAREGLGALTVKALAEEAGVAPSSMLYTMPNHAVVRERALEAIAPAIRKRISALPPEPGDGPERARALLEALLPLDAERRVEASVMQVLSASALTEPGLQPTWREVDGTIRDVCAQALRAQGIKGDVVALDRLHTLTSGLINQLMNRGEDRSLQWVHAVLDLELQRKIEAT